MTNIVNDQDVMIAARTVWAEARGEPYEGKIAVAHVLLNRWQSTTGQWAKDDTLATTCLRDQQFSCWSSGDPNFEKLQTIAVGDFVFRECLLAVLEALRPGNDDPTGGARHYKVIGTPAVWAEGRQPDLVLGHHEFYRNIP